MYHAIRVQETVRRKSAAFSFSLSLPPLICGLMLCSGETAAIAQDAPQVAGTADKANPKFEAVQKFVNRGVAVLAHVDLQADDRKELGRSVVGAFAGPPNEVDQIRRQTVQWLNDLVAAGATDVYGSFSICDVATLPPRVVVPKGAADFDAAKIQALLQPELLRADNPLSSYLKSILGDKSWTSPAGVIAGSRQIQVNAGIADDEIDRWLRPSPRADLIAALQAVPASPVKLAFAISPEQKKSVLALLQQLRIPAPDGAWEDLLDELSWAVVGMQHSASAQVPMTLIAQAKSSEGANRIRQQLQRVFQAWTADGGSFKSPQEATKWLDQLLPDVEADRLVLRIKDGSPRQTALMRVMQAARESAAERLRTLQSKRRLALIGLAMHNTHDATKRFPARAIEDKAGRPLLSWRVRLLPLLDASELYDQFHLDEPWDSAHNRELVKQMPAAYQSGKNSLDATGKTVYQVPMGPGTMFSGRSGPRAADLAGVLGDTIMAVETDDTHAVVWTQPDDFRYDTKQPFAGLAEHWIDGKRRVQVLMGDGAVNRLAIDEPAAAVRALFAPSRPGPQGKQN
jgi:hypothetical protein